MIKPPAFYRPDADTSFTTDRFWERDRQTIAELGGRLLSLDEANELQILKLFDLLSSYDAKTGETFDCLPAMSHGLIHTPLPFSHERHEEIELGSETLESIIESHVNSNFAPKKYLFLCVPTYCIAVEFGVFRYELIQAMSTGWMNDWILICDENLDQGFLFSEDGCLNFYSRSHTWQANLLAGLPENHWIEFFNRNFQHGVPHAAQAYLDFVNVNFSGRIPGLDTFIALTPDSPSDQQ